MINQFQKCNATKFYKYTLQYLCQKNIVEKKLQLTKRLNLVIIFSRIIDLHLYIFLLGKGFSAQGLNVFSISCICQKIYLILNYCMLLCLYTLVYIFHDNLQPF